MEWIVLECSKGQFHKRIRLIPLQETFTQRIQRIYHLRQPETQLNEPMKLYEQISTCFSFSSFPWSHLIDILNSFHVIVLSAWSCYLIEWQTLRSFLHYVYCGLFPPHSFSRQSNHWQHVSPKGLLGLLPKIKVNSTTIERIELEMQYLESSCSLTLWLTKFPTLFKLIFEKRNKHTTPEWNIQYVIQIIRNCEKCSIGNSHDRKNMSSTERRCTSVSMS